MFPLRYRNVVSEYSKHPVKVLQLHLADAFIQSDLPLYIPVYSGYTFIISMCVPWELNPQPFALLTQCSTTEPQEHFFLNTKRTFHCIILQTWDDTFECSLYKREQIFSECY